MADGVQVNSVLPGPLMTDRRRSYLEHWAPLHTMMFEETTAAFSKEAGIARYGEPEEIAELVAFLISPGARWMTGSTLRMDGGEVNRSDETDGRLKPVRLVSSRGSATTVAASWPLRQRA